MRSLQRQVGQVVVLYRGELSGEVLESVEAHDGKIMSRQPLVIECFRAEDLATALLGLAPSGGATVDSIHLRRSPFEIGGRGAVQTA